MSQKHKEKASKGWHRSAVGRDPENCKPRRDRSVRLRPASVCQARVHAWSRARAKAMHRVCSIQLPIGVAHWLWAQKSSCMRKECDQVTVRRSWRSTYVLRLGALADACSTQVIKNHAHLCLRTQEWLGQTCVFNPSHDKIWFEQLIMF
jgi:hypothetical protein